MAPGGNSATASGDRKGLVSAQPCPSPQGTDSTLPRACGLAFPGEPASHHLAWGWRWEGCPGTLPHRLCREEMLRARPPAELALANLISAWGGQMMVWSPFS